MANARGRLESIALSCKILLEEKDLFINEFDDELREIDQHLAEITFEPRCDDCGAHHETVEWCGNCGKCAEHCDLSDDCEDFATDALELSQNGD